MMTLYPWLEPVAAQLLPQRERWSHAWLLNGPEGLGKYALARWVAQTLLCETPMSDGSPCGECTACTWLSQHQHPDYHACLPENATADAPPNFAFLSHAESDWIKLD